jgi:nickel transport protein
MLSVRKMAIVCVLLAAALPAGPAAAHNLIVYATADGATVSGRAYFAGGGAPRGAEVMVLAPDGSELARTTTDEQGAFRFEATVRCDHEIVVEGGPGHRGAYTLPASELPAGLPAWQGVAEEADADVAAGQPAPDRTSRTRPGSEALADQIRELRRELDAYHHRARLHEVIGGVGYIVGVAGLAFFLLGRRRERAAR